MASTRLVNLLSTKRVPRISSSPELLFALAVLAVLALMSLVPELLAPRDPLEQDLTARFRPPSSEYILGSDQLGRDILSRLIFSARTSVLIAIAAVVLGAVVGVTVGMLAGYYGRWLETVLMRLTDVQLALPQLVLAIVVVAVTGPSVPNIIYVMALTTWPWYSRMFFNTIRSLREMEYITAAQTIGASDLRILLRHLLINQWHVLIVLVAVFIRSALVNEATLSFLGLGILPPTPSWGSMLRDGYQVITIAPWLSVFPGLVLMFIIYSINTIGETLRRRVGE